jgi:hypothetical protein
MLTGASPGAVHFTAGVPLGTTPSILVLTNSRSTEIIGVRVPMGERHS